MQKTILLVFTIILVFSCTEKAKTYEELEAEVLCDVLPIVMYEDAFIHFLPFPPPPPEAKDAIYNQNQIDSIYGKNKFLVDLIDFRNRQIDSVKRFAQIKGKIKVTLLDTLAKLDKQDVPKKFESFFNNDLKSRIIIPIELNKSNILFETITSNETPNFMNFDKNKNFTIMKVSRVYFNKNKDKGVFTCFGFNLDSPNELKLICTLKNNKWIIEEKIK